MSDKKIAVVMLHGDCTMRCRFCITDSQIETLSLKNYESLLEYLRKERFENIVLGGGEPCCWPYGIENAILRAKEWGFFVQLGTNALQLDPLARYEHVDRFVLPLDSSDPLKHNQMRRLPEKGSHHEIILRRLEQLKQIHKSVTISTVITRENSLDILSIGNFLADYVADGGILHAWHLYCFIPQGRGGKKAEMELSISLDEFNEATLLARSQHYPFVIFKRPDMRHSKSVDFFWYHKGGICIGSRVWKNKAHVSSLASFGNN